MYYPYRKKTTKIDGKTGKKLESSERSRHCIDRDNMVKRFGKDRFDKLVQNDSHYKMYREPEIPQGYKWIWRQYMFIRNNCGYDFNGNCIFTFQTINEYEKCMKVRFTIDEKYLLFRINGWAMESIAELDKE